MKFNKLGAAAMIVFAALPLVVGACGGYGDDGYGGTPDPANTRPAAASPTIEATSAAPAPATPAELTLVAASVQFDQRSLVAPAGPVTIAFANRDQGIPHNVHVFMGPDASGATVGSTEIEAGAAQQTLVLGDLAAGSYFYQCDVHPSQMMGTLTIA
jgi:plastocyanin